MKLAEAIDLYIRRRRSVGAYLHGPELVLRSFLHHFGNPDLHRIRDVTDYKVSQWTPGGSGPYLAS